MYFFSSIQCWVPLTVAILLVLHALNKSWLLQLVPVVTITVSTTSSPSSPPHLHHHHSHHRIITITTTSLPPWQSPPHFHHHHNHHHIITIIMVTSPPPLQANRAYIRHFLGGEILFTYYLYSSIYTLEAIPFFLQLLLVHISDFPNRKLMLFFYREKILGHLFSLIRNLWT